MTDRELLNECHEKMQVCCKLYYDTCRGTEEEKRCEQWGNQIRSLIQQSMKVEKEFVEKHADFIRATVPPQIGHYLTQMLKELGELLNINIEIED